MPRRRNRRRTHKPAPRDAWEAMQQDEETAAKDRRNIKPRTDEELALEMQRQLAMKVVSTSLKFANDGILERSLARLDMEQTETEGREGRMAAGEIARHMREVAKQSEKHLHVYPPPPPDADGDEPIEVEAEVVDEEVGAFLMRLGRQQRGEVDRVAEGGESGEVPSNGCVRNGSSGPRPEDEG